MTLQRITIAGYKAYPQSVDINLKPITLIYGENSTGKSSLMRILPLIQETLKNPSSAPLTLSENLTKSANLADLFSKFRDDGVIELKLLFKISEEAQTEVEYKLKKLERGGVVLLEFSLSGPEEQSLHVELDLSVLDNGILRYVDYTTKSEIAGLMFDGVIPRIQESGTALAAAVDHTASLLSEIRSYWLAPLRRGIPRISRVRKNIADIGAFGEGCVDVLYEDFRMNGPVFQDVSNWFVDNCSASLQVAPGAHEFGELAGLALVRQGATPVRIPLEDCGEGITQVLPVLVLVALAKYGRLGNNPVIVLEHPDLHLHSNAHFDIIRAISQAASSEYKPRFLLESHAESVLIATQLHVASGAILPNNVSAIHVSETDLGSSAVELVEFDTNGSPKGDFAALDWFERTNIRAMKLAKNMVGLP